MDNTYTKDRIYAYSSREDANITREKEINTFISLGFAIQRELKYEDSKSDSSGIELRSNRQVVRIVVRYARYEELEYTVTVKLRDLPTKD